jgi:glycosyltransferase involved in cell wall biosynthesis
VRVCIVYDCLFPYTVGGAERWYRNLAERLAAEGHDVTYLTLRQWERGEQLDLDPRIRVLEAGPRMALYTGSGRRRILPPILFGLGVLARLLREGRRYDVVHTCAFPYFSLLAAALAAPLGRFALVSDWFEVWSEDYWRDYLGGAAGRVGSLVQRLCARVPQRANCFSQLHAARLRAEGLRGPLTVLRGLYGELAPPATAVAADPVVLFAGRLIPEKQAPLAVEAIALARERVPELRGELFGDGPERAAVEAAISAHGLDGVVHTRGFAAAETLDDAMRSALCVLLPSRREGYGMVVVEASARATPSVVVAGEDNAASELVEDGVNGAVAAHADAETIADAIVSVHDGGFAMRERTAAWYAAHAEELSLDTSLAQVLDGYRAAIAGG